MSGGAFLALGGDVDVVGEGLVDEASVVGVHGVESDGLAGAADVVGEFADMADEVLLFLLAIALDIDDDVEGAFLIAVEDAVEEVLEVFEGVAVATDQATGFAGADVEDVTTGGFHLFDLEDQTKMAEHEFENLLGAGRRHWGSIKDSGRAPTLFVTLEQDWGCKKSAGGYQSHLYRPEWCNISFAMVSFFLRFLAIISVLSSGLICAQADTTALVDPSVRYQTFEGWGVSLAWWGKAVGDLPDSYRSDYMEKVFDPVKGLGFNIVRYNIGGGEDPTLHLMSPHREMDGFEPSSGQWDWDADAGQRWVLQQAKARGATIFESFSNSPPYWMTLSGSVTGAKNGGQNNLATEHVKDFADYLATVVEHFKDEEGIVFRTLDPLNEPNSGWWHYGNNQEGCHFDPRYQSFVIRAVGRALADRNLTTQISAPDENSVDQALGSFLSYPQGTRDFLSQINTHSYNGGK